MSSAAAVVLCPAGVALKHTYEKAFSVENGMRRNVPKVVVAITDGQSQDEVKKNSAKLQQAGKQAGREAWQPPGRGRCEGLFFVSTGYSVFAIGVADADFAELQEIGSKPVERHVFVVDNFDAFDTIRENLITFICETASSCESRPVLGRRALSASVLIPASVSCSAACPLIFLNGFTSPGKNGR